MYCARASRALEEEAGILTERSTLKPLCVQPSMCQPFVEEGAFQEEGDHAGAEILTKARTD
jgi:hypothetical protein